MIGIVMRERARKAGQVSKLNIYFLITSNNNIKELHLLHLLFDCYR